ncbi:MAG: hypothetical protein ACKV22_33370 [Bryobacteraceae bacterium]
MSKQAGTNPWWRPVLFAAFAGGMGWGIRGQYGHETGAMIAGLLVSLVLVLLLYPDAGSLRAARAVALATVAMGFGGSETYGQTVGLTHNADMIGNWAGLSWGLFGLAIKGGVWIGFAGLFLGMGMGGVRYRTREVLLVMLALVGAYFLGAYLLNSPYDPANKILPRIYFSADWRWTPGGVDIKPRREGWGGLWFALALATLYAGWRRKDGLAWRLALWGVVGGAIGFPLGQSLQAYHAWNRDLFREGIWLQLDPHMNWWNMMETTFGATMGAVLGLGAWIHRGRIRPREDSPELPGAAEWLLLGVHTTLLMLAEFGHVPIVSRWYGLGLIMGILPMLAVAGGRWWPYFVIFPLTLLPIAGKTVRELVYHASAIGAAPGWTVYFAIPVLASAVALWQAVRAGRDVLRWALLLSTWTYFLLNFAFFRYPWPWESWTGRTPNAIIFTVCAAGLTVLASMSGRRQAVAKPG